MQPLSPHLARDYAEQHADEVRRAVRRTGRGPAHPRPRLRYRTGWLLVELGLRLSSSAEPPVPSAS